MNTQVRSFFRLVILVFGVLILSGCSCDCQKEGEGSAQGNKENAMQIGYLKIDKVDIWVDLMPGGPAGFLFAGEATLAANEKPQIESVVCIEAVVTSGDIVRKFPFRIELIEDQFQKPAKTNFINFRFASRERTSAEGLRDLEKASIELVLKYKDETFRGTSETVEVKRTY